MTSPLFVLLFVVLVAIAFANKEKIASQKEYLNGIAARPGVIELKSGMLVEILKESTKADGKSPNKGDACDVTYKGTFTDGNKFDAGTTSFAPNQVIKGWTEAMQVFPTYFLLQSLSLYLSGSRSPTMFVFFTSPFLYPFSQYMVEGDQWKLHIPFDLAYGPKGMPPRIPAYSPLVFEIEIHKVKRGGKAGDEARAMFAAAQVAKGAEL